MSIAFQRQASLALVVAAVFAGACQKDEVTVPAFSIEEVRALESKAKTGDGESAYLMGIMHQQGLGSPIDLSKAAQWFKRASELGNGHAEVVLGTLYQSGDGVQVNFEEAARWYRRAADRGMGDAQFNLAGLYRDGQGVTNDPAQATAWYMLAAKASPRVKEADIEIERLSKQLSPDQLQRAREFVEAFHPQPIPEKVGLPQKLP